jgi:O-antigen/teichoic acid export membrane protein
VNVGVDLALIPKYGILGAAIGWAAAIVVSNVIPMAQLAVVIHLHPFGRGTIAACALTALSFCAVPLAARFLLGDGAVALGAGALAGSVMLVIGLWLLRSPLVLAAMPGVSHIKARLRR